jgi:hypothetical protein
MVSGRNVEMGFLLREVRKTQAKNSGTFGEVIA